MPFADLGDFSMFYTDEGSGPTVLLVHGFGCDGGDWSWQVPSLRGKYRIVTVDLRGHGHSTAPTDGYTGQQLAADVQRLLAELRTEPVVAIGHSMGGLLVARLGAEYPEMVRAVVLVDAALGMDPDGATGLQEFAKLLETDACHEATVGFFREAFYPAGSPPHLAELHARRLMATPAHVLAKTFAGLASDPSAVKPASESLLSQIAVPGLTFRAGNQDPTDVMTWERAQFANPYSRGVAWEGVGHFLHQERAAEFNAVLLEWLGGLPA